MKNTKPLNNGEKMVKRDEEGKVISGVLNPNGRPKGVKNLSTLLWEALQEKARKEDGTESDKTKADLVIQRLIQDNIKYGKRTELIFDRIDGQAPQTFDFTSKGETIAQGNIDVLEIARQVSAQLKAKKTK